jgi:hypothetical protein
MPDLPQTADQVLTYLPPLDRAIVDLYNDIVELLQAHTALTGELDFAAADTVLNVVFDSPLEDEQYFPQVTPSWDTTAWVSLILAEGFTLNVGTAPGGTGGTVYWAVHR